MTIPGNSASKPAADAPPSGFEGTIRIEHDRKRLALAALANGAAALIIPGMFYFGIIHPVRMAPAWTLVSLTVAVLIAAIGFVRNIIRLQDGDPALVLSARGLDFRPWLFGEIVRIPWTAIRGFKTRHYKHHRIIVLQVDDIDRYAPRVGFTAFLRYFGRQRPDAGEISFGAPMSKSAWFDLETVLKRCLAQRGRPAATSAYAHPNGARANVADPSPRNLRSRTLP